MIAQSPPPAPTFSYDPKALSQSTDNDHPLSYPLHSLHVDDNSDTETSRTDCSHSTLETIPSLTDADERDASLAKGVNPAPPTPRPRYHRHISRSAAKRDSVAALPSIKDLQAHFSGGAKVEHRAGAGAGIRPSLLGNVGEDAEDEERSRRERRPWKDVELTRVAPQQARTEACALAADMNTRWCGQQSAALPPADLREQFIATARAVRRVRTLAMSLIPPERRASAQNSRIASFSTPSRPSGGQGPATRSVSGTRPSRAADPGAPIRRAALDLLAQLRALEERLQIQKSIPTVLIIPDDPDATLVASPTAEEMDDSRSSTDDRPSSYLSNSSYEWSDDEEYNINALAQEAEAKPFHPPWEERLTTEAREYRDIPDEEWEKESANVRAAAQRWIECVERTFRIFDVDNPTDAWVNHAGTELERVHAFLVAHLSTEHAALLSSDKLLDRLADGYLLVQAYNSSLVASPRPWGFIPPEEVHDTLETPDSREWTFRRVGNLTCWAAALKLRFNLQIAMPASSTLAPVDGRPPKHAGQAALGRRRLSSRIIVFDPLVVAKRADGWEDMLSAVLGAWVREAAREVMGEHIEEHE